MTPNAKAARDGRSSDKRTGAGMFADPDSRLRSACNGTPRQTADTRRRRAAQREAGPLPENALLTVGQLCAEQHICYRHRSLNIQRLNHLRTIRHSPARIAGNLTT